MTVNGTPLLGVPLMVTTTFPLVAVDGTVVTSWVALQLETLAVVPLNVSVLKFCEVPKFVPVIVTGRFTGPEVGETVVMVGAEPTVNQKVAPDSPGTVTNTYPVVAAEGTGTTI